MKLLKDLSNMIKSRPDYPTWEAMPDGLLFFFFVTAALPASYWNYVVGKLYGPYIDAFDQAGFTFVGAAISIVMLALALQAWFFTCISARCGKLVFDRWFK